MRESVLWTIMPDGFRQLTERLFQPNPFLLTLWIRGLVGRATLVAENPRKGRAGGCPACRAQEIVEYMTISQIGDFFSPPFHFFVCSVIPLCDL